jgi:membrane protease YdiL (CAAX protease family)
LSGNALSASGRGVFYRSAWIFYLILAVVGVVWLGLSRGTLELAVFVDLARLPQDILIGTGSAALLLGVWALGRRSIKKMVELERLLGSAIGPLSTDEVIALALISGFAEELFFRGAMLQSWGFIASTLIFGLVHTGRGAFRYWTVFALLAGALFGRIVLLTGTLFPAMLAHILVNAVNLQQLQRVRESAEHGG